MLAVLRVDMTLLLVVMTLPLLLLEEETHGLLEEPLIIGVPHLQLSQSEGETAGRCRHVLHSRADCRLLDRLN